MTSTTNQIRPRGRALNRPSPVQLSWTLGLLFLLGLITAWPAQADDLDDEYLGIVALIQQADSLSAGGRIEPALAKYQQAQSVLLTFRKNHMDWNPKIISYRVNYLTERLATLSKPTPPDTTATNATPAAPSETSAAAAPSGPQVKLLEPGTEPRAALRLHPKPGDKQSVEMTTKISMDVQVGDNHNLMKLPPITMTMEVTAQSVSPEGDITYQLVIGQATIADDPDATPLVVEAVKASLGGVKGVSGTGTLSSRGFRKGFELKLPDGATPQLRQAVEQMQEAFSQAVVVLPAEAVGTGAKWEVKLPLKSQGMAIDQTATYEMVSLAGERLTGKITIAQSASNQKVQNPVMPNLKVDLTNMVGRGTGTFTLDLTQPVPSAANLESHSDTVMGMNLGGQQQNMTLKTDVNLHLEGK